MFGRSCVSDLISNQGVPPYFYMSVSLVRILVLLITSSMFNRLIVEVLVGIYKRRRNREKPLARVDRFLHKTTRASDLVLSCVKSFAFSGLELD